jgi:mRNA interferase YafQ
MKLIITIKFTKQASRLIKNNTDLRNKLSETLTKLSVNPFDPSLFTHKLKGELEGKYSARLSYHARVIFKLVNYENENCILLLTIGSHDEVYYFFLIIS